MNDVIPEQSAFVVFDTETTGLFVFRDKVTNEPVPADDPSQPRMASFGAIVTDKAGQEVERFTRYIKPDGWSIDGTKAAEINGLTDAFLNDNGVPIAEVLDKWEGWIEAGFCTAAFNAQFDQKMMRAELRRAGRSDLFEQTRNVCLMRGMAPYKDQGLVMRSGRVSLANACEFLGIIPGDAHDALGDAQSALEILQRMMRDGCLVEPKIHYAAGVQT